MPPVPAELPVPGVKPNAPYSKRYEPVQEVQVNGTVAPLIVIPEIVPIVGAVQAGDEVTEREEILILGLLPVDPPVPL